MDSCSKSTFRKGNGKKLFYVFHHYYVELKKYPKDSTTEILLLTLLENDNKYPRSKKLTYMTPCFKTFIWNVFFVLLLAENLKKIYREGFELQAAKQFKEASKNVLKDRKSVPLFQQTIM